MNIHVNVKLRENFLMVTLILYMRKTEIGRQTLRMEVKNLREQNLRNTLIFGFGMPILTFFPRHLLT